ncbi:hypothetical protein [Nocardiopsis composta]|uniref:Uncharacterized protein n=1 Tax=Nocardiopsis composta TaxID=157465 RepID=A0A7W8VE36_9ACTN|nr:hypothetical protein [Nocardiopsis composta]MBB5432685.1 hypothetical protein [Nocardiopsis composta]
MALDGDQADPLEAAVARMAATEWRDRPFRAEVRCGGTAEEMLSDRVGGTRTESRFAPPGPGAAAAWVEWTVRFTVRSLTDWRLEHLDGDLAGLVAEPDPDPSEPGTEEWWANTTWTGIFDRRVAEMFRPAMLVSWLTRPAAAAGVHGGRPVHRLTARPRPWDGCGCGYTGWAAAGTAEMELAVDAETGFLLTAESRDGAGVRNRYEVTGLRLD